MHANNEQAAGSWNNTACCADRANYCRRGIYCVHRSRAASDDFLFRLSPGAPKRFLRQAISPLHHTGNLFYQYARPGRWPAWGTGDLSLGYGGPPGTHGQCKRAGQRYTFAGAAKELCGAHATDKGKTDLEVWYWAAGSDHGGPTATGH